MMNRRRFFWTMTNAVLAGGAAAALPRRRALAGRVSMNDKVRVAVIGNGGMGSRHIEALASNPQCTLMALCDVAIPRYEQNVKKVEGWTGRKIEGYQDFYRVLERQDIDAIFVATPDHWHPMLAILGCEAGKDVYVEKPVAPTVCEGRAMVEAARRYGRVMQAGTQQRSMPVFQEAIKFIRGGGIGEVRTASAWIGVNEFGVGEKQEPVPEGLDWDRWLGPSPAVPFSYARFGGHMGWHDYCRGGQLTNWGIHLMDIVQWGIGEDRPLSVQALGGTFSKNPGADNYECIETLFEYQHCNVTWEQRYKNEHGGKGYGVHFLGTQGEVIADRSSFLVQHTEKPIPEFVGEPEKSWANTPHHNNFFDCVRTRKRPAADIEQAFRSTTTVLLAGIALKEGRKLTWDGEKETFMNDPQADRHLTRTYRAPWHL